MNQPTNITSARRRKRMMLPPAPVGRPTKATPRTIDKLCEALRLGATHKLACKAAGISETAFYRWMNQEEFGEFRDLIVAAESDGAMQHLATITALTQSGDPAIMFKAATWLLERRYPEEYARREVRENHNSGEQVVRVVFDNAWRGEVQIPDVTPEQYVEASVESVQSDATSEITITREGDE